MKKIQLIHNLSNLAFFQVPKSGKSYALIGGESLRWTEGEMVAFDDSFEHEYVNEDAEEERIVLSLDVPHPDLTYGSAKAAFTAEAQEAFMNY
jgi:aspartyl/asparaginyl beta-hydroxylase (cupin superfamily)